MKREDILISADELVRRIDEPNLKIFDASIVFVIDDDDAGKPGAFEGYLQAHIPGAAFFDHREFSDADNPYPYMVLPENPLADQVGNAGISNSDEVVVYSAGRFEVAARAWWVLTYAGHDNVRILDGGLDAWKRAGGRLESGERRYKPGSFTAKIRPGMFANLQQVDAAVGDANTELQYTLSWVTPGEGIIPGSSTVPADDLIENGYLSPAEKLTEKMTPFTKKERVITYCGGGIAATVNAIALLINGYDNVAVYDGSMSEWAGEKRPMEMER